MRAHLHVMGSSLNSRSLVEMNRWAIAMIKQRGGTVSFDPNVRKEILKLAGRRAALDEVLGQADVFMPSGDELLCSPRPTTWVLRSAAFSTAASGASC